MGSEKKFIDRKLSQSPSSEKVEYRGKFRIIGQIVDDRSKVKVIGYLVLNELTYTFKAFTIKHIKTLLSKFKFVNAELKNDLIVNTERVVNSDKTLENSFEKLPSYNSQLQLIGDIKKFMILGRVIDDKYTETSDISKFRVIDANLHIVELDEIQLFNYSERGFVCVNGKFVNRKVKFEDSQTGKSVNVNRCIVSSLKGEFPIIEKSKIDETIKKVKKDFSDKIKKTEKEIQAENYRYERHRQKLLAAAPKMVCYAMGIGREQDRDFRLKYVHNRKSTGNYHFKDDAKIEVTEIFNKYIKDKTNKTLLNKHWENLMQENKLTNETYYGIAQFFLYVPEIYEKVLKYALKYPKQIKYYLIDKKGKTYYAELKEKDLICSRFLELEKELIENVRSIENSKSIKKWMQIRKKLKKDMSQRI